MDNPVLYGVPPYRIAVIHGGPGAAGEMSPVARELSSLFGVLEPLQTEKTVGGQVEELKLLLDGDGVPSYILIGFSWGAWLGCLFAAGYPEKVGKLILVGSGSFEERYAAGIDTLRMSRLSERERSEVVSILDALRTGTHQYVSDVFARLGALYSKADAYDPLYAGTDNVSCDAEIFGSVWPEAAEMRRSGELMEHVKRLSCPVVVMHGDYDPHSFEGVKEPLSSAVKNIRFHQLERCGHKPWIERHAVRPFYEILKREIKEL